jgi:hypothetical protein
VWLERSLKSPYPGPHGAAVRVIARQNLGKINLFFYLSGLKGPCHKIEVGPQLRFKNPSFLFKKRLFQSYSPLSSASIDAKSGISDPADLLQLGFQFDCEHERSHYELS